MHTKMDSGGQIYSSYTIIPKGLNVVMADFLPLHSIEYQTT